MKSTILRIMAALIAVVMIAGCFSSCKKDDGGEDITKPPAVEGPNADDDLVDFDDFVMEDDTAAEENSTEAENNEPPEESPSVSRPVNNNNGGGANNNGGGTPPNDGLTQEQRLAILEAAGYKYDEEQQIFYSTLNPWQRHFGFGDAYDEAAVYANMRYTTIKVDFVYNGLLWRIQCWKGQYGALAGGEMGVYTKDPDDDSTKFYDCAADKDLLEMSFKYYKTIGDFNRKQPTFERKLQKHWWLTGFQFGYCDSKKCVMEMTLNAKDKAMADGIEKGLKNVTDYNGDLNAFTQYRYGASGTDFYIRNGNTFKIIWVKAGYQNYNNGGEVTTSPTSPNET